jgi:hypothetical protein
MTFNPSSLQRFPSTFPFSGKSRKAMAKKHVPENASEMDFLVWSLVEMFSDSRSLITLGLTSKKFAKYLAQDFWENRHKKQYYSEEKKLSKRQLQLQCIRSDKFSNLFGKFYSRVIYCRSLFFQILDSKLYSINELDQLIEIDLPSMNHRSHPILQIPNLESEERMNLLFHRFYVDRTSKYQ